MFWVTKSCYECYFKQQVCGEEHEYTTNSFLSFLKKTKPIKQKKIIYIIYLIIVLIKMRLLIFLILCRYRLACKSRIISQISMFHWMRNCIFRWFWYCIFIFSDQITTCCKKSDGLSQDELRALSSAQIAIVHRTSSGRQLK